MYLHWEGDVFSSDRNDAPLMNSISDLPMNVKFINGVKFSIRYEWIITYDDFMI